MVLASARRTKIELIALGLLLALAACHGTQRSDTHGRKEPVCAVQDCASGIITDNGCTDDGQCLSCLNACTPVSVPPSPILPEAAPSVRAPVGSATPEVRLTVEVDAGIQGFSLDGVNLPALSADRDHFAFTDTQDTGGLSLPNLALVIRKTGSAHVLRTLIVLGTTEAAQANDAPSVVPRLRAMVERRVVAANALLAKETWTPLTRVEVALGAQDLPTQMVLAPPLRVSFDPPRVTVSRADGSTLVQRTFPKWAPRRVGSGVAACPFRPVMNAVMTDTPPTLVIIEVNGFLDGGDSCASPSEPVPRYEVVLLPKLEP